MCDICHFGPSNESAVGAGERSDSMGANDGLCSEGMSNDEVSGSGDTTIIGGLGAFTVNSVSGGWRSSAMSSFRSMLRWTGDGTSSVSRRDRRRGLSRGLSSEASEAADTSIDGRCTGKVLECDRGRRGGDDGDEDRDMEGRGDADGRTGDVESSSVIPSPDI